MRFALILALLISAGTLTAAPIPKDFRKPNPSLEGTWRLLVIEYQGERLVRDGETWTFDGGNLMMTKYGEQTYVTDPTASPRQIQLGANADNLGLYEIAGDDLVLSFGTKPLVRPADLLPGSNVSRYLLKRVSSK